jgi:O-antigen/teichoic acid export membrane protein
MLHFGAWATVSGLISPLMVYGDRFFVSAAVGAAVLAYYAVPQEGLQRLLILPNAICSALLVRLASLTPKLALGEYKRNLRRVALWHGAVCASAALLAFPAFSFWISREFAAAAIGVTLVLCLGIWINGVALVPYTLIHAQAGPRTTALFHLGELILYAVAVWWLTTHHGILGAAWAWTFRAMLDLALLLLAARRYSTHRANTLATSILP